MSDSALDVNASSITRDTLVWKINESRVRLVEFASLPADMALMAAQQVNEVRLNSLEVPKDVGWGDIALEVIWTLALNSTFADKLAALFLKKVFARVFRMQSALKLLPKSNYAKELIEDIAMAKRLLPSGDVIRAAKSLDKTIVAKTVRAAEVKLAELAMVKIIQSRLAGREQALKSALDKYASLGSVKKEDLKVYAGWVNEMTESKNIIAVAKAQKDAHKKGLPRKAPDLSTTDGSSVTVMAHFFSAARAQRLHIESLHNHYELIARTYPLSSESFVKLFDMFDINPIFDAQKEAIILDTVGANLRLRMEAMIWAFHAGFFRGKGPQPRMNAPSAEEVFPAPINGRISKYLLARFEGLVIAFKAERGGHVNWDQLGPGPRGLLLRDYFWALTDELNR